MNFSFSDLSGTTALFRDYLYDFDRLKSFYAHSPSDQTGYETTLASISGRKSLQREKLADILTRQNQSFGNHTAAIDNIKKLRQPNTLAVVTGQQMGFFSGPLYTIYKALDTAKTCESWRQKFPDFNFVPVFWLELEDHDFGEIRSLQLFNIQNELQKISYNGAEPENKSKTPVNRLTLTDDILRIQGEISSVFNKTDFTEELTSDITDCYRPGQSIAGAFGCLLARWLGKFGIILMDPSDIEFKQLAKPVFLKELQSADRTANLLTETSAQLVSAGYHAQVETEATNLFVRDDGAERLAINSRSLDKIRLDNSTLKKDPSFWINLAGETPERFIPNVVLRPLVQDYLLPTAAYIAGPGEIAYFGQFKALYEFFEIPQPVILPRSFRTLLEKKIKKVPEKYGITILDILKEPSAIVERISLRDGKHSNVNLLDDLLAGTMSRLTEIEAFLVKTDPSLKGAVATASDKISQAIKILHTKTAEAEKRSHELAHSQLSKAVLHLMPNGNFQEREINILYYLNKYGKGLFDTIYAGLQNGNYNHQVIEL